MKVDGMNPISRCLLRPLRAAAWRLERDFYLPCRLPDINWGIKYAYPSSRLAWAGWIPFLRQLLCRKLYVSERIVEIPFLFKNLRPPPPARILDFGCGESLVDLQLASLGYQVTGYDLNGYEFRHPNLEVIGGDFLKNALPADSFDLAIAISAVEHAGIESYGSFRDGRRASLFDSDADRRVMGEIRRVLKPGGCLIISLPFGRRGANCWMRSYDQDTFSNLIGGFGPEAVEYYSASENYVWTPSLPESMQDIDNFRDQVRGVAMACCSKPG